MGQRNLCPVCEEETLAALKEIRKELLNKLKENFSTIVEGVHKFQSSCNEWNKLRDALVDLRNSKFLHEHPQLENFLLEIHSELPSMQEKLRKLDDEFFSTMKKRCLHLSSPSSWQAHNLHLIEDLCEDLEGLSAGYSESIESVLKPFEGLKAIKSKVKALQGLRDVFRDLSVQLDRDEVPISFHDNVRLERGFYSSSEAEKEKRGVFGKLVHKLTGRGVVYLTNRRFIHQCGDKQLAYPLSSIRSTRLEKKRLIMECNDRVIELSVPLTLFTQPPEYESPYDDRTLRLSDADKFSHLSKMIEHASRVDISNIDYGLVERLKQSEVPDLSELISIAERHASSILVSKHERYREIFAAVARGEPVDSLELLMALGEDSVEIRLGALNVLGGVEYDPRIEDALLKMSTDDPDERVREAAGNSLRKIRIKKVLSGTQKLQEDLRKLEEKSQRGELTPEDLRQTSDLYKRAEEMKQTAELAGDHRILAQVNQLLDKVLQLSSRSQIVVQGDYVEAGKTEIKESVIQRSTIGMQQSKIKFCPSCGQRLEQFGSLKFCPYCGEKLPS